MNREQVKVGIYDTPFPDIGDDRSIIYKLIDTLPFDSTKNIKILLLDPKSPYLNERAEEIGKDVNILREQCQFSAQIINNFKKKYIQSNINIDYKYYKTKYFWGFTLMDDKGFCSYYNGRGEGPELPQFEIRGGRGTLHEAFTKLFDQMWRENPQLQTFLYLFSWNEIPGNDNVRLIEFIKKNFGIDWVKIAKIEKIDNGKTIKVFTEENYLSLKLNDKQTEINLEIDDGRADKFIVKIENSKLNIYTF